MQAVAGEIQFVIASTLLLLLITSFVIVFVVIHQRQYRKYLLEKEEIKNAYQQEILKAQLEMKENTLHTISQEIHDNIGQVLSLVKLNLNTVVLEDCSPAIGKITASKELVGKAIQDLRNLSKSLNTEHISSGQFSRAFQTELDIIQKTGFLETSLQVRGTERPLDPQKQLIIFRIAQEVIHNIIKHARARSLSVVLTYTPEKVMLSISDDGGGFSLSALNDPGRKDKGTGIANMYHRARLIGAVLSIDSQPGKGTLTQLTLPAQF